jgi:hypothetical protein
MNAPPPVLLVADEVTLDPATGKPTSRGIFFGLDAPCLLELDVLLVVTEVRSPLAVLVELHDPRQFTRPPLDLAGCRG